MRSSLESAAIRFRQALEGLEDGLNQVEAAMHDQLASPSMPVQSVGDHVLGSGGKRVRPALLFFSAALCGYQGPRCVQTAAAVELLHTATLLHDDVIDVSSLRRGKLSANQVWGNRRAILVGDFLLAKSSSMIVEDGDPNVLWIFANTISRMSEGELLQMQRSFDPSITESQYYEIIERKSATLLSAACETGAVVAGVTRAERRRIADFGRELGLAFQLRDDALDYESSESVMGKQPFADLREGKVTLPLLLALKRCSAQEKEVISATLKKAAKLSEIDAASQGVEGNLDPSAVVELIQRYRGVEDSMRRADDHVEQALQAIAPFPECDAKDALRAAAEFAAYREA